MTREAFDTLRAIVDGDDALQRELGAISDWTVFTDAVLDVASERGLMVTSPDLERAREERTRVIATQWL